MTSVRERKTVMKNEREKEMGRKLERERERERGKQRERKTKLQIFQQTRQFFFVAKNSFNSVS